MNKYKLSDKFKEDLLTLSNIFSVRRSGCPFSRSCDTCVICDVLRANNIPIVYSAVAGITMSDIDRIITTTNVFVEGSKIIYKSVKTVSNDINNRMYEYLRNMDICRL